MAGALAVNAEKRSANSTPAASTASASSTTRPDW